MEQEGGAADAERGLQRTCWSDFLTQPRMATREDMDYLIDKLDRVRDDMAERPRGSKPCFRPARLDLAANFATLGSC